MTPEEQVELWCNGKSVHNHDRDECCPDFSCCNPSAAAPMEERQTFKNRPELRDAMLMGFLGRALAGVNVHVAGSIEGEA